MRILVVHPGPNFSVADVHNGWVEALRELGCQVISYNLDDRLKFYSSAFVETGAKNDAGQPEFRKAMNYEQACLAAMQGLSHACYTFWPDVVLFISCFFINAGTLQLLSTRGHKIVLHHTESPYQEDSQLVRAVFANVNLVNDPVNLDRYRELDGIAEYVPHAYRPLVHYPRAGARDPVLASDLAFVGTGFASRIEFFEAMDLSGLDVLLGGNWSELAEDSPLRKYLAHDRDFCVDNDETAGIYRHARAGINFYRQEWEDGMEPGPVYAMGPREVEMAACGLFFLRDPRGEGDRLLGMLPVFDDPQDAGQKLRWWLEHDGLREDAARRARAAIADRTFANNARRLLALLEK